MIVGFSKPMLGFIIGATIIGIVALPTDGCSGPFAPKGTLFSFVVLPK